MACKVLQLKSQNQERKNQYIDFNWNYTTIYGIKLDKNEKT